MPEDRTGGGWSNADVWRQMSKPWTPYAAFGESVSASMSRIADLFGFSPGTVLRDLADAVTKRLVGRPLDITFGASRVRLVVRHVRIDPPGAGPMVGQLGNVEIELTDVEWADHRIDHLAIDAHNLHISVADPSEIVAAPIMFTATFRSDTVADGVTRIHPRVKVELAPRSHASVMLSDREGWGRINVEPRIEGATLELQPTGISWRQRRPFRRGLDRTPAIRVRLPLPHGMTIDDVDVVDSSLVVRGAWREWREPVSTPQLQEVVKRIRASTDRLLDLPRLAP